MTIASRAIHFIQCMIHGSSAKRWLASIVIAFLFVGLMVLFPLFALYLDQALQIPQFPIRSVGAVLITVGTLFTAWSVGLFAINKGTPVPINPPKRLLIEGPYRHSRNPMLSSMGILYYGIAFWFGSIMLGAVITPLIAAGFWWFLKRIEEPELELRFGDDYLEYKRNVPMFIPRLLPYRKEM